jgi:predicted permease
MAFLFTFIAARLLVLLIMARKIPDLFLYLGGTHVHHLNYGIFLLAAVGGYLLWQPAPNRRLACLLYGVGMGLTFDEFGMWLHLGGSYWQRASWDAMAVIAASLGLFAYGPTLAHYRPRHWATAALIVALVIPFFYLLAQSLQRAERIVLPKFERIEQQGPQ